MLMRHTAYLGLLIFCVGLWAPRVTVSAQQPLPAQDVTLRAVAVGLQNPRGVAVLSDGSLLIAEAGMGTDAPGDSTRRTGRITHLIDANADGDYNDPDERRTVLDGFASYNSLASIRTGHDEPYGLSDMLLLPDGRAFFTKDDPFFRTALNTGEDLFYGDTGIFALDIATPDAQMFSKAASTVNALAYDPARDVLYTTESGFNRVTAIDPTSGEQTVLASFPLLANNQQPVPSGVTVDPTSGDVIVALFGGFIYDYQGMLLSYVPNDAKLVRVDPESGTVSDVLGGLTTAIDVTADEQGNLYVVELTRAWPLALMPFTFDLTDPDALPDPGGYVRYDGRVTKIPADGSAPQVLVTDIDTPTNITYHDGRLYVSGGLGTPNRIVWTKHGLLPIDGVLWVLENF